MTWPAAPALLLALCALAAPAAAPGEDAPVIREIVFVGNATTRPAVLLREMAVRVGDPADPERLERSRQAIQDLRLFRSVALEQQALDGGVRVIVTVDEKHYLLPLPRAGFNSDGEYSYGVGMRWWNVLGLNHTLHLTVAQRSRAEEGRGAQQRYHATYEVPFLFDSSYGLSLEVLHAEEPVTNELFTSETTDSAGLLLSRSIGGTSHGWRVGTGVLWRSLQRDGFGPLESPGAATALVLQARYDDTRFRVFSEEGLRFSLEGRSTAGTFASDYRYGELLGSFEQAWPLGDVPHQTVGLFARGAIHSDGPADVPPPYSLGGAEDLRGYPLRFLRGERYYYGGAEVLRPLRWNWLRGVAFVEAGQTYGDGSGVGPDHVFADAGFGLRLRLTGFVRTELNVGLAFPLVEGGDGASMRLYVTGHR